MLKPKLKQTGFLAWPTTLKLLETLNAANIEARFVGGCVRDTLLGRDVSDVDLATPTPPEEVLQQLRTLGIKALPTGIEHGTVTIIIDGKPFELTTLRHDVDCDGRHAIVAYTDDWAEDAKRRDFTINALYAAADGTIYDYTTGLKDIEAKQLRFIGDADARIKEDGLRILRLFRFQAQLGFSASEHYDACKKQTKLLKHISAERIQTELLKLLGADDPSGAWQALFDTGIAGKLFSKQLSADMVAITNIENHMAIEQLPAEHRLALLALLSGHANADTLQTTLKLSNATTKLIKHVLLSADCIKTDMSVKEYRKWRYVLGTKIYILCVIAAAIETLKQNASAPLENFTRMLQDTKNWNLPKFPISGADLLTIGFTEGEMMGKALRNLENEWITSGFELSKDELLKLI